MALEDGHIVHNGEHFHFVHATPGDIPLLVEFEREHFDSGAAFGEEEYKEVLSLGPVLMLNNSAGRLVGITAVSYGTEAHPNLVMNSNDAYLCCISLHKEYRGQGLSLHLYTVPLNLVMKRNCDRIFSATRAHNIRSMRNMSKAGFHLVDAIDLFEPVHEPTHDSGGKLIFHKNLKQDQKIDSTKTATISLNYPENDIYAFVQKHRGQIVSHTILQSEKDGYTLQLLLK